jgi:hypothetical protein
MTLKQYCQLDSDVRRFDMFNVQAPGHIIDTSATDLNLPSLLSRAHAVLRMEAQRLGDFKCVRPFPNQ